MSECIDIYDEAFATDPVVAYQYPYPDPVELRDTSVKKYESSYTAPGVNYFKAVDEESGCI